MFSSALRRYYEESHDHCYRRDFDICPRTVGGRCDHKIDKRKFSDLADLRATLLAGCTRLLVLIYRRGPGSFLIKANTPWVLLRSTLLVAMWVAYYTALPEIDLSLAAAGYYTSPLLIVLLSSKLTGDRVGGIVRGAVALGFAGVLVILRPGSVPFNGYVLLPFVQGI